MFRRSAALGSAGLRILQRPHRGYVPLEGGERLDDGGRSHSPAHTGSQRRYRIRGLCPGTRRPGWDGRRSTQRRLIGRWLRLQPGQETRDFPDLVCNSPIYSTLLRFGQDRYSPWHPYPLKRLLLGTFKLVKTNLQRAGFVPSEGQPVFVLNSRLKTFDRVTPETLRLLRNGAFSLWFEQFPALPTSVASSCISSLVFHSSSIYTKNCQTKVLNKYYYSFSLCCFLALLIDCALFNSPCGSGLTGPWVSPSAASSADIDASLISMFLLVSFSSLIVANWAQEDCPSPLRPAFIRRPGAIRQIPTIEAKVSSLCLPYSPPFQLDMVTCANLCRRNVHPSSEAVLPCRGFNFRVGRFPTCQFFSHSPSMLLEPMESYFHFEKTCLQSVSLFHWSNNI